MGDIGTFTSSGFHQGAFTLEDYIESLKRLGSYTQEDIFIKYIRKQQEIRQLAECAKIYIIKNWDKVEDWSGLNVVLSDRDGNETEFYNYTKSNIEWGEGASKRLKEVFREIEKRKKEKHNPVKSFGEPKLDTIDGDFSVTVNGQDFLWIEDEAILEIAGFIEYRLREEDYGEQGDTETTEET